MKSLLNSPFKKTISLSEFIEFGGSAKKLCSQMQLEEVLVEYFGETPNLNKELLSGIKIKYLEIGATCAKIITSQVDKLMLVPLENIVIWLPIFIPEELIENK